MGALGAAAFATSHQLLTEAHIGLKTRFDCPGALQLGPRQDLETPEVVLIELFDRVEEIAVERHQAT